MLEHLLAGRFDISPEVIGLEGFVRNGQIITYWGIFCAFLRLPLLLIPNGLQYDITALSCYVAVCLAAVIKLKTLKIVYLFSAPTKTKDFLFWIMVLTILFSGAQICFLRPCIYDEVELWSGALASIFIYFAVRGILEGGYTVALLNKMAITAGLALLCRVTMGLGLYVSIALLLVMQFMLNSNKRLVHEDHKFNRLPIIRILSPVLILLGFTIVVGVVNYFRWENPFVFADLRYLILNDPKFFPGHLPRLEKYGNFNIFRIPYALAYYFFPLWGLDITENIYFLSHGTDLFDTIEFPISSFVLTDPLLLFLFVYFVCFAVKSRVVYRHRVFTIISISAGLLIPCLLMLSFGYLTNRYRLDFYPFIQFGAFLGFWLFSKNTNDYSSSKYRIFFIVAALLGFIVSFVVLCQFIYFPLGARPIY